MSYETEDKMVSHPDHYKSGKYEVIDIIDEFTKDLSGTEAVCTANAIKYILRWKKKNGIQDVKKAIWYLQHLVDKEEERLQEEHAEFDEERLEKMNRPPFVDIQPIKDNTKYTKEVDLGTGKVTVTSLNKTTYSKKVVDEALKNWKPKLELEPGCDKCEISECKFLEDPFMNPPYNVLWDKWKEQKETIKKLMRDKKEMQDSIDDLTERNNSLILELSETQSARDGYRDEIRNLKIEKHEIRADLKCLISNDLNNLEEIDKHAYNGDLVRMWCRHAGVDVQKINDRYFTETEVDMDKIVNRPTNEE